MWIRGSVLGLPVVDRDGEIVGRVTGTLPLDGSDPEFALVSTGRFGGRIAVPLDGSEIRAGMILQVPYPRWEVEDAPSLDGGRFEYEQIGRARSYWAMAGV